MDMKPVFKSPPTLPAESANIQAQRPAMSRPFSSQSGPVFTAQASTFASQPQQVFVSQTSPQAQQPALQGTLPAQPAPAQFEKAVSQVLTFFFGHKKDKTEEKERRDRDDFAKTGLFGEERKVEESNKSNLGGGQS